MGNEVSKNKEVIGNEISFPVRENKPRVKLNARKLFRVFLSGYILIAAVLMGIRCTFFINAHFAEGVVSDFRKSDRGYSFVSYITFSTEDGVKYTFRAAQNLKLDIGEPVRVIYKVNNPERAAVFSFFGFWFNSVLACQVLVLFWVGFLIVYYGDYP